MLYNKVVQQLERNKSIRENGGFVAIPWDLPRLSKALPGIVQGRMNIVTANAKVGKTQLGDFLYLYQPIEWLINNIERTDIKLKIFYFSLEMSKESKIRAAISYKLFKSYKRIVSPENLQSFFDGYILDDELLKILKSDNFKQWFRILEDTVEFIDSVRHNYGIYNIIKTYAETHGKYTYKEIDWTNESGEVIKKKVKDSYIPNNPNEYVIIITDHISLIHPSKEEGTLHKAMGEFSSNYMLEARDKWNYIPVIIQQQGADKRLKICFWIKNVVYLYETNILCDIQKKLRRRL